MEKDNITLDPFFQVLNTKFKDLIDLISNKEYILIAPAKSLVTESELTLKFYYNHIYKVSKYDPTLYINLNGKILKYEGNHFDTFLNWSKDLNLEIKDVIQFNFGNNINIQCYQLANAACDESIEGNISYLNKDKDLNKDDEVPSCKSINDYLKFFDNLKGENAEKAKIALKDLIYELKHNVVFMKGYESSYVKIFNEKVNKYCDYYIRGKESKNGSDNIKPLLSKKNGDNIVHQLTESLIFSNLYDFLKKHLNQFFKEKNDEMRKNIKDNIYKYELNGLNIDENCKSCKLEKAIDKLNEIEKFKTIFEKVRLLIEVNNLIIEEVKNVYETKTKKTFNSDSDQLLQFWIFVITHSKIINLFAEVFFLTSFILSRGFGPEAFVQTTFLTACSILEKELVKGNKVVSAQKIEAQYISLNES
jgi:hypothetical protein